MTEKTDRDSINFRHNHNNNHHHDILKLPYEVVSAVSEALLELLLAPFLDTPRIVFHYGQHQPSGLLPFSLTGWMSPDDFRRLAETFVNVATDIENGQHEVACAALFAAM